MGTKRRHHGHIEPTQPTGVTNGGRRGKELFQATRGLARESLGRSWWYTVSTFAILAVLLAGATWLPGWPTRLVLSVTAGLVVVRTFVLYHDFMHGALLRGSRLAKLVYYPFGLAVLAPPHYWRYSHNHHHAHVSKPVPEQEGKFSLLIADVGTMPLMTTDMWQLADWRQRLRYRISRHPLTILLAYLTVFFFSMSLAPAVKNPRKFWDGALAVALHLLILATVGWLGGFSTLLFACLIPSAIASSLGAYLFFAQHNFEELQILSAQRWSHFDASLESSSYLKLGRLGNWFTANIGYHHVHHLNSQIPFYRLPEAMAGIAELQHPPTTTLHPRDILKCLNLSLWDPRAGRLVSFRQASAGA